VRVLLSSAFSAPNRRTPNDLLAKNVHESIVSDEIAKGSARSIIDLSGRRRTADILGCEAEPCTLHFLTSASSGIGAPKCWWAADGCCPRGTPFSQGFHNSAAKSGSGIRPCHNRAGGSSAGRVLTVIDHVQADHSFTRRVKRLQVQRAASKALSSTSRLPASR
jgi:hypothetical protein